MNYWLKRVITKLNAAFLSGTLMGQWTPDEDDPEAESRALDTLEIAGVIKSPGGFLGAPAHLQYRVVDLKSGGVHSAPTRRIVDFDYDKFIRFCETSGYNPTPISTSARLEIIDDTSPTVYIDNKRYIFAAMGTGGLPQQIVAFAWKNPDTRLSLDELRQNIEMVQLKRSDINLNQIFDKKNVFGKNGALNAFAEINVKDFLLKRTTLLTPSEIENIKSISINQNNR